MATKKFDSGFRYHIVPASVWFKHKHVEKGESGDSKDEIWTDSEVTTLIREKGGIFINDHFLEVFKKTSGVIFNDGGFGSSKTTNVITKQLLKSLTRKYHKCYYGRKVKNLTREFHSNIITEIKRNGWEKYFEFGEGATSTLTITCKLTGNKFIGFGLDEDLDNIKGWNNPTDIIVDEINQIEFEHFGMLVTRLRTAGSEKLFEGMFNNPNVMPGHWLLKYIYIEEGAENKEEFTDAEKRTIEALNRLGCVKHHSTYKDNYFVNPEQYLEQLALQAGGNAELIDAYANGDWGVNLDNQPYYKNFKYDKHVLATKYKPELPLWISWDDNVNPYQPLGVFQRDGMRINMLMEIKGISPNNNVIWVCRQIIDIFGITGFDHQSGMFICGDATARKTITTTDEPIDYYIIIKDQLRCFSPVIRVPSVNPSVAMRKDFINAVMGMGYGGISVAIDPSCKETITDLKYIEELPDTKGKEVGGKFKPKKKVNGMSGVQIMGHFSDIFDYVMVQMFKEEYQKFQYNFNNIKGKVKTVPKTPIKNTYSSTSNGRGSLNYVRSRNGY